MKLGQILIWLEDVDHVKITSDIWEKVCFTRLNHHYNIVFNMAKLFYNNSSVNLNKGDETTLSFLVPVNQLFERYVFELIKKSIRPDISVKSQSPIRYLGYIRNEKVFQLKPDITIIKDERVVIILDAKYKEIIDFQGNNHVQQSDIYQMLAYSVKYNCNQIILVYPKMISSDQNNLELFNIEIPKENSTLSISIIHIDLECEMDFTINQLSTYFQIKKFMLEEVKNKFEVV